MDALSSACLASFQRPLLRRPSPPLRPHPTSIAAVLAGEPPPQTFPKKIKKSPSIISRQINKQLHCSRHDMIDDVETLKAQSSPVAGFCNALDDLISTTIGRHILRPSIDPRCVLASNFSPVPELPPTFCPLVKGTIPKSLIGGAYIRNGPNPQHLPQGTHHLFEGDGMLHSIILSNSGGILSSRFVHTYRYSLEESVGRPIFPKVLSGLQGLNGIARMAVWALRIHGGQVNPTLGAGLANTSLSFFANRIYALAEEDLPYAVEIDETTGDISTVGRSDFDGKLSSAMTAHPKIDPETGEMFAFRWGLERPYATYFWFDSQGNKSGPDVPIFSLKHPTCLHDFAITKNYAIFNDLQIVIRPMEMLLGDGSPIRLDPRKVPRVGLLPRYATSESEMRWFNVPGFNATHTLNAWEEEGGNVVVLIAPNVHPIEHSMERMDLIHCSLEMLKINLRTNTITRTALSSYNLDLGVINPNFVAKKNRFAYMAIGDPMPKIRGIAKLDLDKVGSGDCVVGRRMFGEGCFGGEPFFVANDDGGCGDEDDGHVLSYVHDERRDQSRFVVMDAKTPDLEVVGEILLPQRVPYGFHGLFVSQKQLQSQQGLRC
uniref:Carotenoid cleavage dioxygenase 4 n=1 Tax=Narcissus pseudonarcissus TaxID=39639 RepID=A0A3S9JKG4_NARPS|nr:carotenoid cleavage dioxygenase 4 [Narcissus pseudonarcissus]